MAARRSREGDCATSGAVEPKRVTRATGGHEGTSPAHSPHIPRATPTWGFTADRWWTVEGRHPGRQAHGGEESRAPPGRPIVDLVRLAEVINATDTTLHAEVIATKASKQNLLLLEQGEIDIGLVEGNAARQALDGIRREPADLKVLSVMYPNPGMFVVRADSPYQTIEDLKGRRIAFGTRASRRRILARDVLDGLGLDPDRDFQQAIVGSAADGPRLVLEEV